MILRSAVFLSLVNIFEMNSPEQCVAALMSPFNNKFLFSDDLD